jgi:uncharacterized membrane protein
MNMHGVSLIGWLHSITCTVALLAGGWNFLRPKGTATHRLVGRIYFYVMLFANLSVFAIYHFDIVFSKPVKFGPGHFGIFHWEAVATLIALLIGVFAASRQRRAFWAYAHPIAMLFTYYMLIGGLINELFVRVAVLRNFALAHGRFNVAGSPIVGMAQFAAMLVFLVLLIYFPVKVALYRRRVSLAAA